VNVNFSASYVFNVHSVAPESPGALFFQLDVTNVFP